MLDHTLNLSLDDDRHLIVGDLHGRYDQFMRMLDAANYDPTKDIIYSVGDLIDRGPKSTECVEFFKRDRCYAIKGNHELMMMDSDWFTTWVSNGGVECMDSARDAGYNMQTFADLFRDFPWIIDVGDDDEEHSFRIVHAEVPPGWSDSYLRKTLNEALNTDDVSFSRLVWSRKLITHALKNANELKPVAHGVEFHPERSRLVFAGHTPCEKSFRCGDHWFLDTWAGGHLTMIDAITKETFTTPI